jgi:hypothetical protein
MSIVWMLEWNGIGPVEYEKLRTDVSWESADGLHLHIAAFDQKGLVLTEVWESPDHVQPFMDDLLLPAVQKLGVTTMPRVDLYEMYKLSGHALRGSE